MGIRRNDCLFVGISRNDLLEYIDEDNVDTLIDDAYDKKVEGLEHIYDMDNSWIGKVLNSDTDPYSEMGSDIKTFQVWQIKETMYQVANALEIALDEEIPMYKILLHHGTLWA